MDNPLEVMFEERRSNVLDKALVPDCFHESTIKSYSGTSCDEPGDLVSLAWLQRDNILQIAPLDAEDEVNRCAAATSGSFESFGSNASLRFHPEVNSCPMVFSEATVACSNRAQNPFHILSGECLSKKMALAQGSVVAGSGGFSKPNYSYTHLIFMAIESTPLKCMTVNQIYNWCESNFPFYKHAGTGWKNSLRHNLSINKSFKRLPRDSRNGSCVLIDHDGVRLFTPVDAEDDEEGPGRGAFWTVEPLDRAPLLDALKRSPWCFANPLSSSLFSDHTSYDASSFAANPHSFSQSVPVNFLRPDNKLASFNEVPCSRLCMSYPNDYLNILIPSNSPTRVAPPSTTSVRLVENANYFPYTALSYMNSDSEVWVPPSVVDFHEKWSLEEEENYVKSVQLLVKSSKGNDTDASSRMPTNEASASGDENRIGIKQKRKTRLRPTLAGTCNECKENAAVGCDSCHMRSSFDNRTSAGSESAYGQFANSLDSDQECGPAGGPSLRKPGSRNNDPPYSPCLVEEVFVTPAPYVDHEYSHCQAQLRKPEESHMVEAYNENYLMDRLKQFKRSRRSRQSISATRRHDCLDDVASDLPISFADELSDHDPRSFQNNYCRRRRRCHNTRLLNLKSGSLHGARRLNPRGSRVFPIVRKSQRVAKALKFSDYDYDQESTIKEVKRLDSHPKESLRHPVRARRYRTPQLDDSDRESKTDEDSYLYQHRRSRSKRRRVSFHRYDPLASSIVSRVLPRFFSSESAIDDDLRQYESGMDCCNPPISLHKLSSSQTLCGRFPMHLGLNSWRKTDQMNSVGCVDVENDELIAGERKDQISNQIDDEAETANLLLGISQMKSFRRQSGYLSPDSSLVSSSGSPIATPVKPVQPQRTLHCS